MAFSSSGLYTATYRDALKNVIALDMTAGTHKVAMYTNTLTPNFDADPATYSTSNEVSGTGYTAGGATLTSPTLVIGSGNLTFDGADVSWASSTISNARGAIIYADGLSPKAMLVAIAFGADYSTVSGTFTVQWSGSGIFVLDLTP